MNAVMTLRETRLRVCNQAGIHLRAAAKLVMLARSFQSTIRIRHENRWANAASMLDVLALGVGPGEEITAIVLGQDADTALPALQQLFDQGFYENELFNGRETGHELELCTEN